MSATIHRLSPTTERRLRAHSILAVTARDYDEHLRRYARRMRWLRRLCALIDLILIGGAYFIALYALLFWLSPL